MESQRRCLFTVKSQSRFPAVLALSGFSFTVRVDRSRRDIRSAQIRWLKTVLFFLGLIKGSGAIFRAWKYCFEWLCYFCVKVIN